MNNYYKNEENYDEHIDLNNTICNYIPFQDYKEEFSNEDINQDILYFNKKNDGNTHNHLDEKATSYQTNLKNLKINSSQEDENKEQTKVISIEKIMEILEKNIPNTYKNISKNIVYDNHIKEAEDHLLLKKKRVRKSDEEFENMKNECNKKETIKRRGRKIMNNRYTGHHDKYTADNMIKKVKGEIFDYSLGFTNNMLNKYKEGNRGALFPLDYKIKDTINQEKDLNILNMSLKDLFSNEITSKIKSKSKEKDFNKKKLEKILNEETDDTILFTLNMRFIDWFDIFTFKKTLIEVLNQYNNNNKYIDLDKIKKNLITIDTLLIKKSKKNLDEFSLFLFYIYNYERWFKNKKPRKKKYKQNDTL